MRDLVLKSVRKTFRHGESSRRVIDGVDLQIPGGELLVILGPSGCGKTTLLRMVAGLIAPDPVHGAELSLGGRAIIGPGPERNVVFQAYTSLPWLTAIENVRFGLRAASLNISEQYRIAEEHLDLVGLHEYRHYYPRDLSGGQRQRVAIARTLAAKPDIMLMDEPFAALDAQTREKMQDDLLRIWQQRQCSVLFVTHDVGEAAYLGQRVVLLSRQPARVLAIHTPAFDSCFERRKAELSSSCTALSTNAPPPPAEELYRGDWLSSHVFLKTRFGAGSEKNNDGTRFHAEVGAGICILP